MTLLKASLNAAGKYLGNVRSPIGSLRGLLQGVLITLPRISINISVVAVEERI